MSLNSLAVLMVSSSIDKTCCRAGCILWYWQLNHRSPPARQELFWSLLLLKRCFLVIIAIYKALKPKTLEGIWAKAGQDESFSCTAACLQDQPKQNDVDLSARQNWLARWCLVPSLHRPTLCGSTQGVLSIWEKGVVRNSSLTFLIRSKPGIIDCLWC